MSCSPAWGSSIGKKGASRAFVLKASGAWAKEFHRTWAEQGLHSLEGIHEVSHAWGPRAKKALSKSLDQTYWGSWRVSWGGRVLWLTVGATHWRQRSQRIFISVSSSGGCHFGKIWPHPTACRHEFQEASGQATNRVRTQTHPSTDMLPKVFLGTQPLLTSPLNMALPTRVIKPKAIPLWAGISSSHQEASTVDLGINFTH